MKRNVPWYLPALGLRFLNEPESWTLQSALHRKAPICTSSMVTQESRWAFRVRTSSPPWISSNSSTSWWTGGTDDIHLFVTLAAFLSLQEVLFFKQFLWQQKSPVAMAVVLKLCGTLLFKMGCSGRFPSDTGHRWKASCYTWLLCQCSYS